MEKKPERFIIPLRKPRRQRSAMHAKPPSPALETSRKWCRAATRHHAKSFYFASFPLPPEKKHAAYAVYAFCRHADDLVDEAGADVDLPAVVEELGRTFDVITLHGDHRLPFAPAFASAVETYGLEKQPFQELVEGVGMDLGPVRIADWPALRHYCYHVASVVGLIMCPILGLRDPAGRERAIDLGIAMQLTNIIRDVGEDLGRDRIYLPADELANAGIREDDLRNARTGPQWTAFLQAQIARAREYYQRGESGIPLLANDGSQLTVRLMSTLYADILRAVEKNNYNVFHHRARTTLPRKLALALKAWRSPHP